MPKCARCGEVVENPHEHECGTPNQTEREIEIGGSYYSALHLWVRNTLGRPKKCSKCGTTSHKRFEWANISGEYKKEVSDWIRLCSTCHARMDKSKAHCPKGHELICDNLYVRKNGHRDCRVCQRERLRINRMVYGHRYGEKNHMNHLRELGVI